MWSALGMSYEILGQIPEAIKCYKRAVVTPFDEERNFCLLFVILAKLGQLYARLGQRETANYFFKKFVEVGKGEDLLDEARSYIEESQ
jgi:tetratricopeptide (TPR) repeat protein